MIERLRHLASELDECDNKVRRGLLTNEIVKQILAGAVVGYSSIRMGPVTLEAEMARSHGWSEEQIERAWSVLEAVSRSEGQIAYHNHPELFTVTDAGDVIYIGD